jgi:hypothetical protein
MTSPAPPPSDAPPSDAAPHVRAQIAALDLDPARPLLVTDCDEVLVRFIAGLERYLGARDHRLDLKSFALTGNIKRNADDHVLTQEEVSALLANFYAVETDRLDAYEGAADALARLSAHWQIVVLTNIPEERRPSRSAQLRAHGMDYPVIANTGLKGPALSLLAGRAGPLAFVDDIVFNIRSALDHVATAACIHMVQEPRLVPHAGRTEGTALFATDWRQAEDFLMCHPAVREA